MKLPRTIKRLRKFINRAEQAGACESTITRLRRFKSIREFYDHDNVAYWLYWYARIVIKGRWPEAEDIIKRDAYTAYYYARYILQGRWPEAEEIIRTDPRYAYWYARYVTTASWQEAIVHLKVDPELLHYGTVGQ